MVFVRTTKEALLGRKEGRSSLGRHNKQVGTGRVGEYRSVEALLEAV